MEDQLFNAQWITQLGVGGAFAALLFWFYRKDVRSYTDLWKSQAELNAQQTEAMMNVVRENTAAFTANSEILKALHRRIDRLDGLAAEREDRIEAPGGRRQHDHAG